MLAKICVLILALGMTAGVLLHMRQARLQAVHELARAQLRMNERDQDLFAVRAQIAAKVTPERIEEAARRLGPLAPTRPLGPREGKGGSVSADHAGTEAENGRPADSGAAAGESSE